MVAIPCLQGKIPHNIGRKGNLNLLQGNSFFYKWFSLLQGNHDRGAKYNFFLMLFVHMSRVWGTRNYTSHRDTEVRKSRNLLENQGGGKTILRDQCHKTILRDTFTWNLCHVWHTFTLKLLDLWLSFLLTNVREIERSGWRVIPPHERSWGDRSSWWQITTLNWRPPPFFAIMEPVIGR